MTQILTSSSLLDPHLFFSKEFLGDYRALNTQLSPKISGMKENHLVRQLMLEGVETEKRDHVGNDLREKLKRYEESYAKRHGLLDSLKNKKKYLAIKLGNVETKVKELVVSIEPLKSSLEVIFRLKKYLKGKLS